MQDVEGVKDRFNTYERVMVAQEMQGNIGRAASFLEEQHAISYYSILNVVQQIQDNLFKQNKGQKEIVFFNELIKSLSHLHDLKVTYSNGFHVNKSITSMSRLNLDITCHSPDYKSFF